MKRPRLAQPQGAVETDVSVTPLHGNEAVIPTCTVAIGGCRRVPRVCFEMVEDLAESIV
jgi:hypothetical protein